MPLVRGGFAGALWGEKSGPFGGMELVIARRSSDAAWPRPVWGVMPPLPHDAEEVQNFISALRRKIWLG